MPERKATFTRVGSEVVIRMQCADAYEAIALNDRIVGSVAERGVVTLRIEGAEPRPERLDANVKN